MHSSIKAIAGIYALLAVASISHWVYAVLFIGSWDIGLPFVALWLLGLARGLVTFRPWARTIGLVISGLLGATVVLVLIVCLAESLGAFKGMTVGGLMVERPVAAWFLIALYSAFSAWQWWVFSRPQVRHLYSSKSA